ncbi:MAG: hypothetical protein QOE65_117, partial [Solirubrobacteraceae bacterium]|nr:hypothetical protein [Solirubrobacteraceae bacterium]
MAVSAPTRTGSATAGDPAALAWAPAASADRGDAGRAGRLLTGALLAVLLYSVFAHGAASQPQEARLQVALCLLAAVTLAVALWSSRLRVVAPPAAWTALGLLAAFAAWSGLSLAWSVDPPNTWTELNRAIAYVLVVALAVAAGSWDRRAIRHVALGYAAIAGVVAVYALGGKAFPGLHVGGLVDLDHTNVFARLREPLQYWNALALFVVLAIPIVLRLVVDDSRPARARTAALVALPVFLTTIGLTYSRGGLLALIVAVAVTLALAGARLRTLLYLALGIAASAPALAYGYTADDLTGVQVSLSAREGDGVAFALLLAGGMLALALVGRAVLALEARTPPRPARSRAIGRALAGVLCVAALGGVVAMAASDRGLSGTISHAWDDFRSPSAEPSQYDPSRLVSKNAGNRWVWWSEAAGAWSDHPLEGSGAGSFPVRHREYRTNQLDVL